MAVGAPGLRSSHRRQPDRHKPSTPSALCQEPTTASLQVPLCPATAHFPGGHIKFCAAPAGHNRRVRDTFRDTPSPGPLNPGATTPTPGSILTSPGCACPHAELRPPRRLWRPTNDAHTSAKTIASWLALGSDADSRSRMLGLAPLTALRWMTLQPEIGSTGGRSESCEPECAGEAGVDLRQQPVRDRPDPLLERATVQSGDLGDVQH